MLASMLNCAFLTTAALAQQFDRVDEAWARIESSQAFGALQLHLDDLPQPTGAVTASVGETWSFQAWYRDANPGATSNFTNGAHVTLQ